MNRIRLTLTLILAIALLSHCEEAYAQNAKVTVTVESANEETGRAILVLRLNRASANAVRVTYNTRPGDALPVADFISQSGEVVFSPGAIERRIVIPLVNDRVAEPPQSFSVALRSKGEVVLEKTDIPVTIRDGDPDPTISIVGMSVVEGSGGELTPVDLDVQLSERSEKPIRFTLITTPNVASQFEYVRFEDRLAFDVGTKTKTVRLFVVADDEFEGRQQFYVSLRAPTNAVLDPTQYPPNVTDRIREEIVIVDDDILTFPAPIQSDCAFEWIGSFDRPFTVDELDALAMNYNLVVIAKFHASYNIQSHHIEAMQLKSRKPSMKVLPYFNAKFWFPESQWGTAPDESWYLRDLNGVPIRSTTRTPAYYYDLRIADCRNWILDTVNQWMATGLYDGIAFDSAGSLGDFSGGDFWRNAIGEVGVQQWNSGLQLLLSNASVRFSNRLVLFNGIARSGVSPPNRNLDQLAFTDGALHERFAIDVNGNVDASMLEDIELLRTQTNRILLMKSNLKDNRDIVLQARCGRFCYAAFLMGWTPGQSYFKFAIDDFYNACELEDDPPEMQIQLGLPLGRYSKSGNLLWRQFESCVVALNIGSAQETFEHFGTQYSIPPFDAIFVSSTP